MPRRFVLDAGVLSLLAAGSPRLRPLLRDVQTGKAEGLVCDLSLAEHQYKACQTDGMRQAHSQGLAIRTSSLRVIRCSPYLDLAWRFKCRHRGRFSFADCVVLAVAQVQNARILTTDSAFENVKEPRVHATILPVEGDEGSRNG